MSRGIMAIFAGIGLLIALGLLLTHQTAVTGEVSTFGGVLDQTIRDLQLQPAAGTHK